MLQAGLHVQDERHIGLDEQVGNERPQQGVLRTVAASASVLHSAGDQHVDARNLNGIFFGYIFHEGIEGVRIFDPDGLREELARRAGIRVETLCRIETGKHTPSVPTIDKLDRALKQAARQQQAGKRRKRATASESPEDRAALKAAKKACTENGGVTLEQYRKKHGL